jgi:checkpoint serine/threonine-protein kinase
MTELALWGTTVRPPDMAASSSSNSALDLSAERARYRAQVQRALEEDADPLATYERFVKWTGEAYRGRPNSESQLTELLHEVTARFKEDAAYKTDLRYLQMWSLYASRLPKDRQAKVYRGLVKADIGVPYAQLWEEFASVLERDGQ